MQKNSDVLDVLYVNRKKIKINKNTNCPSFIFFNHKDKVWDYLYKINFDVNYHNRMIIIKNGYRIIFCKPNHISGDNNWYDYGKKDKFYIEVYVEKI